MIKHFTLFRKTIITILCFGAVEVFGQDESGKSIERLNILLDLYNKHFVFYISKMVDSHQAYWESDYKRETSVDTLTKKKKEYRTSDSTYLSAKVFGVKQNIRKIYTRNLTKNPSLKEITSFIDSEFRKEFDDEGLPSSFYDEVHKEVKRIKILDN